MGDLLDKYLNEFKTKLVPAVVGFLTEGEKVLLGKRTKVSNGLGQDLISGIGGKVELKSDSEKETSEEALVREVYEEICVKLLEFEYKGTVKFIFPHKPHWSQSVDIYVCTKWEGDPVITEVITPIWFDKNNLPVDKMWIDNQFWINKVLNGEIVDGVFLYNEDNEIVEYELSMRGENNEIIENRLL
jgi:8-oxo-dGTP diphosphatase